MGRARLFNALLWIVNVALAGGIVVFAFQYLIVPEPPAPLPPEDAPGDTRRRPPPQMTDYTPLRNLANPVVPRTSGKTNDQTQTELERAAKLLGGYSIADNPDSEVAFLQVIASNLYVNAYRGEPITSQGQVVPDLRGWTLVRLTEDGAVFTNGQKEVTLRREAGTTVLGPPAGGAKGAPGTSGPFELSQSTSKKTAGSDAGESWLIDRAEADWAAANMEQLMADVQLSAYADGGVKIDSAGSFASQRGFVDGDVIQSINGMSIKDRGDLLNLANSPQVKNAGTMTIQLVRAGRPFRLDFRPGPKAK